MSVPVALAEPPAGHLMLQTAPRRGSVLLLATTLAATFLRPPWPSRGIPSYTPRGALGFGAEDQNVTVDEAVDQIVKGLLKNAEKFVDYVEDESLQRAMVKHLSEKGNLTTLNLIHEAKITLVGVNHLSREAAKFAERQVRKNKPSALVLELCEERVGMLVLGNCYREASRKNLMKPDEPDAMRRARVGNADEARRSFRGLMARTNGTGSGQLLVLADLKESFIGSKVTYDDVTKPEIRAIRDHNLAVQIFQTVLLDHHCIVAILGANHLEGVEKELRAFNESFAALGGSFSEAASTFGTEMWLRQPMPTGLYISASGCKKLQALQKKLQEKVPLEKWRKRKSLAKKSRVAIESKLFTFSNSKKICSALLHDDCNAKKPSSWRDLKEWWDRVLKGRNKRTT